MNDGAACEECESIGRELREAYAEAWLSSDQATRDALIAVRNIIGGTDEDVERAEELVASGRFQNFEGYRRAVRTMFKHLVRTGHKVPRRQGQISI